MKKNTKEKPVKAVIDNVLVSGLFAESGSIAELMQQFSVSVHKTGKSRHHGIMYAVICLHCFSGIGDILKERR